MAMVQVKMTALHKLGGAGGCLLPQKAVYSPLSSPRRDSLGSTVMYASRPHGNQLASYVSLSVSTSKIFQRISILSLPRRMPSRAVGGPSSERMTAIAFLEADQKIPSRTESEVENVAEEETKSVNLHTSESSRNLFKICHTEVRQIRSKAWIVILAETFLVGSSARAESVADACLEFAGGNLDNVIIWACVLQAVALTGAAVGGIIARQRKNELEKINGQLRQININLRKQSRVESYAPSLTYAPVGGSRSGALPVRTDPVREELMMNLKGGKQYLRENSPAKAFVEFKKGLELARQLEDPVEEKKAARGLGASCQRQGKYKEAINYHSLVLSISQKTKEHSGNTEAFGAIADCYTELNDLESAAKYYDQYIERLESEDID